jgi:hypothetical protein
MLPSGLLRPRLRHTGCTRRACPIVLVALDRRLRCAGCTSYVQPSSFKTVVMLRGSSFLSVLVSGARS